MKCLSRAVAVAWMMAAVAVWGQSFGMPLMKSKVTLQRKLPALMQLPGNTVKVTVTGHAGPADLPADLQTMLSAELVKNDPRLSVGDRDENATISCQIMEFEHPAPTTSTRPGIQTGKSAAKPVTYTRVTGMMRVSFTVRGSNGRTLGSDNITSKYDEEFDTSGNAVSGGIFGSMKNSVKRVTGGAKAENMNPPTDAELREKLIDGAVQQIVAQVVNTDETIEVLLAKGKGMDEGVKDAEAGLWSRALETWETMPALPRPVDDAYRLYDTGVAYEAMAYASDDIQAAMKFLDQASIDYGKAIDSNPGEKYFREPQKRIETALAHYDKLEHEKDREAAAATASASAAKSSTAKKRSH